MMDNTMTNAFNSMSIGNYIPQTILATNDKVFQTGQIWSFSGGHYVTPPHYGLPLYYGKIQKIIYAQEPVVTSLEVSRLMASRSPEDVIEWEDKNIPISCGAFYVGRGVEVITPDDVSLQIMPEISAGGGNEYTILPKIGEVWVIYRFWHHDMEFDRDGCELYDVVEILDDSANYEVLLLEHSELFKEFEDESFFQAVTEFKYNEGEGSEPIFTIPKSERLRFSHKVPASRVTKEIMGELKELIKVVAEALPINLRYPYC